MPNPGLSVAQIINLACQQAGAPGFTLQAGQKLNLILQEVAQSWNFAAAQGWISGSFLTSPLTGTVNSANVIAGSGPYALPSDFLRMDRDDFFWQTNSVNYFPVALDMSEFDALIQSPGSASFPTAYAIDTSTSPAGLYVWTAASGAYQYFGRYHQQKADIASPETSATVPWFPSQMYLDRRLTGEVAMIAGDYVRAKFYLDDAETILNRFIKLEGNNSTRSAKVSLDQRSFRSRWSQLSPTKTVPW